MGTLAKVIAAMVKARGQEQMAAAGFLWGSFWAGASHVIGTEQCGAFTRSASSGTGEGAGREV
jgi:hypothetical protein